MADDPAEELFAAAAGEEAAMGGFCAFELGALIRNRGGGFVVRRRGVVRGARCVACAVAQIALVTSLISDRRAVQELRIKSRREGDSDADSRGAKGRVVVGSWG